MIRTIVALAMTTLLLGRAYATSLEYLDFADVKDIQLLGPSAAKTTADGHVLRLVPAAGGQQGAVYDKHRVTLGPGGAFSTRFQFRITSSAGAQPSDGMTFFMAKSPAGLPSLGGGHLGYVGLGHSVAVEFDTYYNGAGYDAKPNEVAVDIDGNITTASHPRDSLGQPYGQANCGSYPGAAGCLADGNVWTAIITYDGSVMNVYVEDSVRPRYHVVKDYPIAVETHLGGDIAYVGFTAATGGGYANFDILNWTFDSSESVLYRFDGHTPVASADGAHPNSGLVADASGALYGTTLTGGTNLCQLDASTSVTCGTLFKLSPPATAGAPWTESIIYDFSQNSGWAPQGQLQIDPVAGVIYGTTQFGVGGCAPVGCGTVFALTLPSGNAGAAETVLHTFDAIGSGIHPTSSLILSNGTLYGTTLTGGPNRSNQAGVVFSLAPPATTGGTWTFSTLYPFTGGSDGGTPNDFVLASSGTIYGTTSSGGTNNNGVVYALTPPASPGRSWTESTVYAFSGGSDGAIPLAGPAIDAAGNLYGTTSAGGSAKCGGNGCGIAYRLTPGNGSWSETIIYTFHDELRHPNAPVIVLSDGSALYGTTGHGGGANLGAVFKLTPPSSGTGLWTDTQIHSFLSGAPDGNGPSGGLNMDTNGVLYGTTLFGGGHGAGTVFAIDPS